METSDTTNPATTPEQSTTPQPAVAQSPAPAPTAAPAQGNNLDVLFDVPVKVSAVLGGCELPMQDVLGLSVGSVVQLDKLADAPIDLYVNNKLFARGEVVVVEERFAIKVTEIVGKS